MESLGTLAGGIAHDFNNILGIIIGYTEMAQWDVGMGSPAGKSLREVLLAAGRAKSLVQQILAFSRKSEQEKKPVQVGLVVKEALQMLRASLPSTIDVRNELASDAFVLADPTQIHQVLMNLCANAANALQDDGGELRVSLTEVDLRPSGILPHADLQAGPYMQLTVHDTGHGIDAAILDRIFDPFFTTKGQGVGTGLGLSVVHGIVQSLGGAAEVQSTAGKGTTFQVLLPRIDAVQVMETVESAPLPRGQERILVVDDEPALANVVQQMLEHLGYTVMCCGSGKEAMEAFVKQPKERPFQLVVTDMTMPYLTGIDLARELHTLEPKLPVILLTGFSTKVDAEKSKNLPIQGFLMKPVVMKDLAELVRKVLDKSSV